MPDRKPSHINLPNILIYLASCCPPGCPFLEIKSPIFFLSHFGRKKWEPNAASTWAAERRAETDRSALTQTCKETSCCHAQSHSSPFSQCQLSPAAHAMFLFAVGSTSHMDCILPLKPNSLCCPHYQKSSQFSWYGIGYIKEHVCTAAEANSHDRSKLTHFPRNPQEESGSTASCLPSSHSPASASIVGCHWRLG